MIHGRVYKIYCNETGECYYGSTEETLSRRLSVHKGGYKAWKNNKGTYTTSYKILERGNYVISLMEEGDFENKDFMKARERHYIENNECVNKNVPNRMKKEWYEAYPEYNKEYYQANKEHIAEKDKRIYQKNKEQKIEKSKENYYANKVEILEKKKQKITCECGSVICRGEKARHFKSKKHADYLANK